MKLEIGSSEWSTQTRRDSMGDHYREEIRTVVRCATHQKGIYGTPIASNERYVEIPRTEIVSIERGVSATLGRGCQHAEVLGSRLVHQKEYREHQRAASNRKGREHHNRHGRDRWPSQQVDISVGWLGFNWGLPCRRSES